MFFNNGKIGGFKLGVVLDELISRVGTLDGSLADALKSEIQKIQNKREYGLVYEPHAPEGVRLWGKKILVGDIVNVLPPRGVMESKENSLEWQVVSINAAEKTAHVVRSLGDNSYDEQDVDLDNLVAYADFRQTIYPGLVEVDRVERGGKDDPYHVVINGENFHALQAMLWCYAGKVDCIYIDPPYNTGATDWKYNNDYVDKNDQYRHSKWLSFMEQRLKLAKKLLKNDGVLIVTIDDNEESTLSLLLNQIFPDRMLYYVVIQHNKRGTQGSKFAVTHETAIYCLSKDCEVYRKPHSGDDISPFRKWGNQSNRSLLARATTFYPVIVDSDLNIIGFGDVVPADIHPSSANVLVNGFTYVYPIDSNNVERKWRYKKSNEEKVIPLLKAVRLDDGTIDILIERETENTRTVWTDSIYIAEEYGTKFLNKLLHNSFPYAKSLYAERDCLWHVVSGKPDALVLDFFAGSGTTLNAVNLLNAEDGGHRRCILITNNEVEEKVIKKLVDKGFRKNDEDWEKHGICRSITWPRNKCTILGCYPDGSKLNGTKDKYLLFNDVVATRQRVFKQLTFCSDDIHFNKKKKKEIVSFIGKDKLSQSLVTDKDTHYVLSDDYSVSILFDDDYYKEWLDSFDALEEPDNVREFYIITQNNDLFNKLKKNVNEMLGDYTEIVKSYLPMSEGFKANAIFFDFKYEDGKKIRLNLAFKEIAPLLWMRAGSKGKIISDISDKGFEIADQYAILFDFMVSQEFIAAVKSTDIKIAYIVTDSEALYQQIYKQLPKGIEAVRLYENYLTSFAIYGNV